MTKRIVLLFFVTLLFSTCKKYPDGPLLSLYSKEHRVVGKWDVEYFEINGIDSTAYLKNSIYYGLYSFSKEKEGSRVFVYDGSVMSLSGSWNFSNNKNNIVIFINQALFSNFNIGPYGATNQNWEILRLKEHELWLSTEYNGKNYLVKFKQ